MKKINVWDCQTRIFHWSLVVFMLCTVVTSDFLRYIGIDMVNKDTWLIFHITTGVSVGILLFFRILWGLCGPHYSRFTSLHLSLDELVGYFKSVLQNRKSEYTGHNPAASWSALGIIALGLLAIVTGTVLFGLDEGRGILRGMYLSFYSYAGALKLVHLVLAYLLTGVFCAHVCGVLNETIRHRSDIIPAMFTGKKFSEEEDRPFDTPRPLRLLSYLWVISPLGAIPLLASSMETTSPVVAIPPVYKKECGACHFGFPPNVLPAQSWKSMMANLQNHFGEDATIDEMARQEIEAYLTGHAAEKSREEASIKFVRSIGTASPDRITDIPYWKEKHRRINQAIYRRTSIKSRINCAACHRLAEYGSFEDGDIRIPRN